MTPVSITDTAPEMKLHMLVDAQGVDVVVVGARSEQQRTPQLLRRPSGIRDAIKLHVEGPSLVGTRHIRHLVPTTGGPAQGPHYATD